MSEIPNIHEEHTESLPVKLTEKEVREYGEKLAELEIQLLVLEEDKKKTAKQFNGNIEILKEEIHSTAGAINNHEENRQVLCEIERDFEHNVVKTIRKDTGETVSERAMDTADHQENLV